MLHYAVLLNNVNAVKVLFHEELPQSEELSQIYATVGVQQTTMTQSLIDITQDDHKEVLNRKPTPKISISDNNGLTAIHIAAINNNIELISLLLRHKAEIKILDHFDRTPLHYIKSESATKLLLTYSSHKHHLEDSRNAKKYGKTLYYNITLQTSLRKFSRDLVNMPDREGNTPLRCVMKNRILKEESNALQDHGALTYLFNDTKTSRLHMMMANPYERFEDMKSIEMYLYTFNNIMNNSAPRQLIIYHVCYVVVLFFLFFLSIAAPVVALIVCFEREGQNSVYCIGNVEEYDNITLVQMTRSLYVILFTLPFLWLLSISKLSVFLWRKLLFVQLLGCGSLILLGVSTYVPLVFCRMWGLLFFLIFCLIHLLMSIMYNVVRVRSSLVCSALWLFIIIVTLVPGLYAVIANYLLYTEQNLDTLKITVSNCTDFSSVNITCTSLANNIT